MNKALGYVALLLFLTAVGCAVVALATSYWAVHDNGDNFIGFFQKCGRPPGGVVLCSNNFDKDHRDTYKDDGNNNVVDAFLTCSQQYNSKIGQCSNEFSVMSNHAPCTSLVGNFHSVKNWHN